MTNNLKKLLHYLSDGKFHSGAQLGKRLGITRSAVWKLIEHFANFGIEIEPIVDKGYRIPGGVDLLNIRDIKNHIAKCNLGRIKKIQLFDQIDSTNAYLMELARTLSVKNDDEIHVCLAEQQTKGKGRLGRRWLSPFGANIYLSVLWPFLKDSSDLAGLSLVIATVVTDVLEEVGIKNIGLKWPNDVLWNNRKLAGILIEMSGEANGVSNVVIGIGLNVNMPPKIGQKITQPWVDIREIIGGKIARNLVAGKIISHLIDKIPLFKQEGMLAFSKRWKQLDLFEGKPVQVITPGKKICGIAKGVDNNGCLRLQDTKGQIHIFSSGEIQHALKI